MPIYEYQGQQYDIATDDPQLAKHKILTYLETGKARESAKPKPITGEGGAAFGMYPQAGRRPESQQDREAALDMPLQTARGIASNIPAIAGIPGSVVNAVANAPRTGQMISNRIQSVQSQLAGNPRQPEPELPPIQQVTPYDMSYFANLTPGPQPSSPAGQLAFNAGQIVGSPIVPPVAKMAGQTSGATVRLIKDAAPLVAHPLDTAMKGSEAFLRGYRNPEMRGVEGSGSALMPIRETYVPHPQVEQFRQGKIPAVSLTEEPTSNLINTPIKQWAKQMAPTNAEGQSLVSPKGKGFEGFMENLGAGYKKDPYQQIVDAITTIGSGALVGLPLPATAIAKTIPALASRSLQQATQFEPGFGPMRANALAREGRVGLESQIPSTQNLLPAPGPVSPTMIAGPTGQITAPGGRPLPTQASGQPVTQPLTQPTVNPKQFSQNLAASKLAQQTPPQTPVAGPVQPQPISPKPQPIVQPTQGTRSSADIRKELDMIGNQSDSLHQKGLEEGIKYGTPEGESHQAQLGQLNARTKVLEKELEDAIKTEKKNSKPSKKGPSNVSQMLTTDTSKIPKEYQSPELTAAMLKEEGQWSRNGKNFRLEKLENGQTRLQVRKDGQVIDERFL